MKKAIPFLLAFLIAFVYHFDTLKVVSKMIGDNSLVCVDDFAGEEEGAESENSKEKNEKNEKSDFSDDFYLIHQLISTKLELMRIHSTQNHNFSSSDYSQVVYSPPELA